jgi:hypothetical protein
MIMVTTRGLCFCRDATIRAARWRSTIMGQGAPHRQQIFSSKARLGEQDIFG